MAAISDPVQQAFAKAIDDFKVKLDDASLYQDILQTRSIDQVYIATEKLQEEQRAKSRMRHLSKIEPYLHGLSKYASAIEVFVQVKPDILALIWGPIKLLLQWASVLTASFDAIINTTAEIGKLLPEFEITAALFPDNKSINEVLILFFKDILDFYLIALQVFKASRLTLVFDALWSRKKDKIDMVCGLVREHAQLLRNGARIEDIRQAHHARQREVEHFEASEKAHRDQEYHRIRTDLSPVFYDAKLHRLDSETYTGTGEWLATDATFMQWLGSSDAASRVLWIQGIPGAGKTFLCSTAVKLAQSAGHSAFAFLTFRDRTGSSALEVVESLIFQLTSHDGDLRSFVIAEMRGNHVRNLPTTIGLFQKILDIAGTSYLIIDGLDEIDFSERRCLLSELLQLSKNCDNVKLLVSSRPESDIIELLRNDAKPILVHEKNSGSISAFVSRWTDDWCRIRRFDPDIEIEIRGSLSSLSTKAEGMFLFAKLVLESIRYINDTEELYEEVRSLPESLDEMYERILSRVNKGRSSTQKAKARRILGWIACSPSPMNIQELRHALAVDPTAWEKPVKILGGQFNFVELCGPIIEVINNRLQFVHFTVKEYITNPRISGHIPMLESNISLSRHCIAYLCQEHHGDDLDNDQVTENLLSGAYALHHFAAQFWWELAVNAIGQGGSDANIEGLITDVSSLFRQRRNHGFQETSPRNDILRLQQLEKRNQDIYQKLCQIKQFQETCSDSQYHVNKGEEWNSLDPLAISHSSIQIHEAISSVAAARKVSNSARARYDLLRKWQGPLPFLCGYLSCSAAFETPTERNKHEATHSRPWKCNVSDCQYAEGGFLSQKMRDDHLDSFHTAHNLKPASTAPQQTTATMPLLLDLARTNQAATLDTMIETIRKLHHQEKEKIMISAASSGSIAALESLVAVILSQHPTQNVEPDKERHVDLKWYGSNEYSDGPYRAIFRKLPEGAFIEGLKRLLPTLWKFTEMDFLLGDILRLKLQESYDIWKPYGLLDSRSKYVVSRSGISYKYRGKRTLRYCSPSLLRSSQQSSWAEEILLDFWSSAQLFKGQPELVVGHALAILVKERRYPSRVLEYLLDLGTSINYRPKRKPNRKSEGETPSPLGLAMMNDSSAGLEIAKLLLLHGADTTDTGLSEDISTTPLAKKVPELAGMSWDELVQEMQQKRK